MFSPVLWAGVGTGFIFLMSALGAALVFFMGNEPRPGFNSLMLGFSAGVMSAAAVWSLLLPAIEQSAAGGIVPGWLPAALGILAGSGFLGLLDRRLDAQPRLSPLGGRENSLLFAAITLHNIPEGMAVGLAFALASDAEGLAAAWALALGIGVQNLPEGAAVALPLRQLGMRRGRAFSAGLLSAAVEPIFGMLAVLLSAWARPVMPWLLSFAAGAMLYVCAHELIPQSTGQKGSFSYIGGFILMMTLDVALG